MLTPAVLSQIKTNIASIKVKVTVVLLIMTTRPYLRSSLARSLFEKMVRDDNLRNLDKSKMLTIIWCESCRNCLKKKLKGISWNGPELKTFVALHCGDGDDFVRHIVAEDETWCHHCKQKVCHRAMEISRLT
ncbi:hypothetical protein TNCV_1626941 [Trichonephila clavipes]|nr:hypothetical protein TNCV_1626941 [Trichonephila clavipes]